MGQVHRRIAFDNSAPGDACRRGVIDLHGIAPSTGFDGKAVRKVNRAETEIASARELLTTNTEARRLASDFVEAGTANRSAFLESEASVFNAQADVLRAEYDRSVAAGDLARLTGNL